MAGTRELIAAYFTMSRSSPLEPPRSSVEERIDALAAAGVTAMGIHIDHDVERWGPLDVAARHAASKGVRVPEVEFLVNWSIDGEAAEEARRAEERAYQVAAAFGSRHLNVGIREGDGEMAPLEIVAERFAAVCDRAAEHDLVVAFEFMPFRAISNLAEAWELVKLADRPNAGILVDAWHWFRGTSTIDMLGDVPPERIALIQICDGAAEPVGSLLEDTMHHRSFPGEGTFALEHWLEALRGHGVTAPLSVEVLSASLREESADFAAQKVAECAERLADWV